MFLKYRWVDESQTMDAFCFCIAVGARRSAIDAAFKVVLASMRMTLAKDYFEFAGPESSGNDVVQIFEVNNAIVTFEGNGWTGDDEEVIKQIAAPMSVSIFRNVNAVSRCTLAQNGEVIRQFDPLLYDASGALPEETALQWKSDHPLGAAFALAEMLTGVEITRSQLLDTLHPTYRTGYGN